MTNEDIEKRILELFRNARQNPEMEYEKSHFLDFLTNPPHKKNTLKNTFKGVKKYYRFMDLIELEFGICFKLSDLDKYYSVEGLRTKIIERMGKPAGNRMVLKQRQEKRPEYLIDAGLLFILAGFYIFLGLHWLTFIGTVLIALIFYWIYSNRSYEKKHLKKLELRLLVKEK